MYLLVQSLVTVGCIVGPPPHPPARHLFKGAWLCVYPQPLRWQAMIHVTGWNPTAAL